jgi:phosphohistidine phosphatase
MNVAPAKDQTMKTLVLMRHAKAEPDSGGDKARQLVPEGRQDAGRIGQFMLGEFGAPGSIIASDAVRARQTAEIVANALDVPDCLMLEPKAYTFEAEQLLAVLKAAPDVSLLLLIAHSPALEEMTGHLVGTSAAQVRLPPGGFVLLVFASDRWDAIEMDSARLLGLVTPASL